MDYSNLLNEAQNYAGQASEELESAVTDSVQVEPEMVDSRGDDGSGVFSEEERRAWWDFHKVEMRGAMGSDADAGWQLMRSRRCCRAHGISSRLPVGRAFDAVQDVRLVDCGSRLGGASNKCCVASRGRWDLPVRVCVSVCVAPVIMMRAAVSLV